MMKSVCLLGCAFLTATSLAMYGAYATNAPTPRTADRHSLKPFDSPVLAQNKNQDMTDCRLCHAVHAPK